MVVVAAFTTILQTVTVLPQVGLEGLVAVIVVGIVGTLNVKALAGLMKENPNGHDIRLSIVSMDSKVIVSLARTGRKSILFPLLSRKYTPSGIG